MLPNWKDVTGVWDRMKKTKKPIALYGMGNGAQMILDVCQQKQIPVAEIFASDEFVRGHSFAGYTRGENTVRLLSVSTIYPVPTCPPQSCPKNASSLGSLGWLIPAI